MSVPTIKVPTYETTLPFSKKTVKFRPYLVKEEKLLIMANEGDDTQFLIQTIGDIVKACTFGVIDITKDAMFDVQYVFLQIRGKSQGETIEFLSTCGNCNKQYPSSMHIDDFKLKTSVNHTQTVDLGDGYKVLMQYPTFYHFLRLFPDNAEESDIYGVVAECIDKIYTEDEVFTNSSSEHTAMLEFIENMTPEQFEKIEKFFETMPLLQYHKQFNCECGQLNTVIVDGIANFFE